MGRSPVININDQARFFVVSLAMGSRPGPPADVAQLLRAEARFGCCRCGHPFYQYHHIVPWEQDQHFRPEDMMVLCPNCHDMTRGGLSVEEQRKFKSRPHNMRKGYAAGIISVPSNVPVLSLGGTLFVNDGTMLAFKGEPVLSASLNEVGGLELSLNLEDREGRPIAMVERNEWVSGDTSVWDLECGYRWLKIRARKRQVLLEVDAKTFPIRVRANLWRAGKQIFVGPNGLAFGGQQKSVQWFNMTFAAMYFSFDEFTEVNSGGQTIKLNYAPDPRYGSGKLFAGTDPDVLRQAVDHLVTVRAASDR